MVLLEPEMFPAPRGNWTGALQLVPYAREAVNDDSKALFLSNLIEYNDENILELVGPVVQHLANDLRKMTLLDEFLIPLKVAIPVS